MRLRHFIFNLNEEKYNEYYTYSIAWQTRFICNYLERIMRKSSYLTDGTYNMLCVYVGHNKRTAKFDEFFKCIHVYIPFEKKRFDQSDDLGKMQYYVELFREAFVEACKVKDFPIDELNHHLDEFVINNYENVWEYKKKTFREIKTKVLITARFTMHCITLTPHFIDTTTKKELCSGVIITTRPDEMFLTYVVRDLQYIEGSVCVMAGVMLTNLLPIIKMDINKIKQGIFNYEFKSHPDSTISLHKDFRYLRYDPISGE